MAFVGQVQRLGWKFGNQGLPAAVFVFDDALIFVKLQVGAALGMGLRAGKKEQEAINALAALPGLTPRQVLDRWPKALNLAAADIFEARLDRSVQGLLLGTQQLDLYMQGGVRHTFMAVRDAKEPLAKLLGSLLGARFTSA